jgi:hypothetical protein
MSALTLRLPEQKHQRLKKLAKSKGMIGNSVMARLVGYSGIGILPSTFFAFNLLSAHNAPYLKRSAEGVLVQRDLDLALL